MNRNRRQIPDFRYWTLGENTYYVPAYVSMIATGTAVAIGLASPVIILAIVAWSFMA